jgi:hypothetical protein
VHGVAKHKAFFNAAFPQAFINLWGNVDEGSAARYLKPEFFSITLHHILLIRTIRMEELFVVSSCHLVGYGLIVFLIKLILPNQ